MPATGGQRRSLKTDDARYTREEEAEQTDASGPFATMRRYQFTNSMTQNNRCRK